VSSTDTNKRNRLTAFGPVWDSAGVRGFSREGYWYHKYVPGLSFEGSIFVTKTVTTWRNRGNTPLTSAHEPRELFPKSVIPYFQKDMVLNSAGLSNPGFMAFLNPKSWFSITDPFFISFTPIEDEDDRRVEIEVRQFIDTLKRALDEKRFASKQIALQLNLSCPNSGDYRKLIEKARAILDELSRLGIPIVVKLNLLVKPEAAAEIATHPACTGLCTSNSIPFGEVLPESWWRENFGHSSPLAKRGFTNGGLSGAPLRNEVIAWIRQFRRFDTETYINAGGGILQPCDVDMLRDEGADSVFIGSVAILRPWRVRSIIQRAHEIFN